MDVSVVIPLFNERESLPELKSRIDKVMSEEGLSYEILMIDDGSSDGSRDCIRERAAADARDKGIRLMRN